MDYKRLFILVEGDDDFRFFNNILKPIFRKYYDYIKIITYAREKKDKIDKYVKSMKSMGADYIFVSDINRKPCITVKKLELTKIYSNVGFQHI